VVPPCIYGRNSGVSGASLTAALDRILAGRKRPRVLQAWMATKQFAFPDKLRSSRSRASPSRRPMGRRCGSLPRPSRRVALSRAYLPWGGGARQASRFRQSTKRAATMSYVGRAGTVWHGCLPRVAVRAASPKIWPRCRARLSSAPRAISSRKRWQTLVIEDSSPCPALPCPVLLVRLQQRI
jgi:hypothetical protein